MLVAHVDTVWGNNVPSVTEQNGVLYNSEIENLYVRCGFKKETYDKLVGFGIGADDRVGCWILYNLLESGHSILLNEYEEIHLGQLINSRDQVLSNEILMHKYAMEFDRGNSKDLCFYNNETEPFKNFIKNGLKGYLEQTGSGSDISELCKNRIPAVNVSCGYYKAHTPYEYVIIEEAENTLKQASDFLTLNQSSWCI